MKFFKLQKGICISKLGRGRFFTSLVCGCLISGFLPASLAAVPEISHVHPDFIGGHVNLTRIPHQRGNPLPAPELITGENFHTDGLWIKVWEPPGNNDQEFLVEALSRLPVGGEVALPPEPPREAILIPPMDVEEQVIVAPLSHPRQMRSILWIGNESGVSEPILFHVAKPLWISEDRLEPGGFLRMFGYGLRREYRENYLALKQGERVVLLQDYGRTAARPSRAPFYISYETRLLETNLPSDLEPGTYEVYAHNGYGGEYGWRKAGDLDVVAPTGEKEPLIDARKDFGAVGNGLANDTEALQGAANAAADGGGVVFLPPGTYRIDHTLQIPSGVILRGAGRDATIVEGFGFLPTGEEGRDLRDPRGNLRGPFSVIVLEPRTGMEGLTVKGSVAHGSGGHGQVELRGGEEVFPDGSTLGRVSLRDVALKATTYHPDFGMPGAQFHATAFRAGLGWRTGVYRVSIIDSEFHGDIRLGTATRPDIIGNTIRGGAIQTGGIFDGFLSANIMKDDPYRMYSYRPVVNTYFRSNEIRNFGNRRVAGASEPFMLHGGGAKQGGFATGATDTTLVDTEQEFEPGEFAGRLRGFRVLITAGRGFGQYREVIDNTGDTLILKEPWRVIPDATSEYAVGGYFINTVFYDNFNDGLGRMTLWYDCINVVVEHHRDNTAGGIDIWGGDRSDDERPGSFSPSWYNMIIGNEMEGSTIYFRDNENEDARWNGPILFGNYIVGNNLVRPVRRNVRQNAYPAAAIDIGVDHFGRSGQMHRSSGRNQYTFILNNTIADSTVGIRVPEGVRKTFVLQNIFFDVRYPILDFGSGSVMDEGNRFLLLNPENGILLEEPVPSESD